MGAGMSMPMAMLLSAGIGAGGGALSAAMSPTAQQRQSFEHTPVDPVNYATDAKNSISNVLQSAVGRANEPVDLSSALPMSPGSFRSLIPPQSVGGFPANNGTPNRVKFDGFNIQPVGNEAGQTGLGTAVRRNPIGIADSLLPRGIQPENLRLINNGAYFDALDRRRANGQDTGTANFSAAGPTPTPTPSPTANAMPGATPTGANGQPIDPGAIGAAQLLLHSIFARPGA